MGEAVTDTYDWYDRQETTTTAEGGHCLTEVDRNSALRKQNAESRERNARVAKKSQEISDMITEKLGEVSK